MIMIKRIVPLIGLFLFFTFSAFAQNGSVKLVLLDSLTNAPIEFASVYVSKDGTVKGAKHSMTDTKGEAVISGVAPGRYIFKAELMGYKVKQLDITVGKTLLDLGVVKMEEDVSTLEQVVVSAVGNPIVVKKDTIEYNASSVKISDNDMLEDLIKKLPGFEVNSDGSITANGETIKKVMIDGKEFFLDDPQLASKNIPAKIVNKVKVVEKKSEQAEFTGIDDGEEETVLDLSIKPGMMQGWFGNISGGGGMDMQRENPDGRFQAAGMAGRFTAENQISVILNGNNTNNRGFMDMAGEMMGAMRANTGRGGGMMGGGGMGGGGFWGGNSGITTSWMGGVNANAYLLDGKMEAAANYLYNGSDNDVREKSDKTTLINENQTLHTKNELSKQTRTDGHRAGARVDWKLSDKTSILFTPNFNYGYGDFREESSFSSDNSIKGKVNDGHSLSTGDNNNWRANGRLLFRQKIGNTKGRTISANFNYNISSNDLFGRNFSQTNGYENNLLSDQKIVDQEYRNKSNSYALVGRLVYTEPLGRNFFLEGAYRYRFSNTASEKMTYDKDVNGKYTKLDTLYSSKYDNTFINQEGSLNLVKQEDKYTFQVGVSVQPATTKSVETLFRDGKDRVLEYSVLNFAPSARFDYNFSDHQFLRINYRGSTNQPSLTQLQPVPDNSNPLYISLGNPSLQPEFTHRINGMFRNTNMSTFASTQVILFASYVKDDIITASWYNSQGIQYSAPINSKEPTFSGGARLIFNSPIAKSKFSIMSFTNLNISRKLTYTGNGDVETLAEIEDDLIAGKTTTFTAAEHFALMYRGDIFYGRIGGRASYQNAWYSIQSQKKPSTWTNTVNGEFSVTMPWGTELKTDGNYTFFIGYESGYNEPRFVWNAEISQLLFKKQATLRFKVYDLLNQSKNVYRTTADNYVQDVVQNTLGQYFMISFTYRFGKFGGQGMGGHRGGGRGPMGPPRH